VNLLRNSGFARGSSHPRLPDYWGVWGTAVFTVRDWTLDHFGVDERVESPVPGVRVLRIWHPPADRLVPLPERNERSSRHYLESEPPAGLSLPAARGGGIFYVVHGPRAFPAPGRELPPGEYTLSVYLKAARDNTLVLAQHPTRGGAAAWRVGTAWRRYAIAGGDAAALSAFELPEPDSLIWMAAPQL